MSQPVPNLDNSSIMSTSYQFKTEGDHFQTDKIKDMNSNRQILVGDVIIHRDSQSVKTFGMD
jgi:hypothetical protein